MGDLVLSVGDKQYKILRYVCVMVGDIFEVSSSQVLTCGWCGLQLAYAVITFYRVWGFSFAGFFPWQVPGETSLGSCDLPRLIQLIMFFAATRSTYSAVQILQYLSWKILTSFGLHTCEALIQKQYVGCSDTAWSRCWSALGWKMSRSSKRENRDGIWRSCMLSGKKCKIF